MTQKIYMQIFFFRKLFFQFFKITYQRKKRSLFENAELEYILLKNSSVIGFFIKDVFMRQKIVKVCIIAISMHSLLIIILM